MQMSNTLYTFMMILRSFHCLQEPEMFLNVICTKKCFFAELNYAIGLKIAKISFAK